MNCVFTLIQLLRMVSAENLGTFMPSCCFSLIFISFIYIYKSLFTPSPTLFSPFLKFYLNLSCWKLWLWLSPRWCVETVGCLTFFFLCVCVYVCLFNCCNSAKWQLLTASHKHGFPKDVWSTLQISSYRLENVVDARRWKTCAQLFCLLLSIRPPDG